MGKDILVRFECVQEERYTFSVKNPRNNDEFYNAFTVFMDKISNKAYKTFNAGEIQVLFTTPTSLGRTVMLGGSYSECVDVKYLIIKIDTTNYLDYIVDYKLYAGYPWGEIEHAMREGNLNV